MMGFLTSTVDSVFCVTALRVHIFGELHNIWRSACGSVVRERNFSYHTVKDA